MKELSDVLDAWRSDAAVLRRAGHETEAVMCERMAGEVEASAEEWVTFVTEADAMLRSGRSAAWHRGRFAEWERDGHARIRSKLRYYRLAIIPRRYDITDARAAGAAAARKAKSA